jgi:peptidoglycan/LPS O-acetylase OafA/YrhL
LPTTIQDINALDPKGEHLGHLDGWRGIAILLVLWGHFAPIEFINLGTLGVDFFFVLSGRLMAHILFVKKMALPQFFGRRFSRVYPALLVFTVLAGLLCNHYTRIKVGLLAALSVLTFTSNYASIYYHPTGLYDHIWSLCVEEHSYVILGALACLDRHTKIRTQFLILAIGVAATMNGIYQTVILGYDYGDVYWRTDVQCAPIFLAVYFFLKFRSVDLKYGALLMPLFLAMAIFFKSSLFDDSVSYSLGTLCLVLSICFLDGASAILKRALSFAPLRQIGLWSFSLYLWQQPFYQLNELQKAYWHVPATIVVGLLSFYLIEKPTRAFLNAKIGQQPQ